MEINYLNLKKMFNHILENIAEEKINMSSYRNNHDDFFSHECGSTGCIIGHCLILDDWNNIPKYKKGNISFRRWSKIFTGIKNQSSEWSWCFGIWWPNNKEQILLRLKYFIDNKKIPDGWDSHSHYDFLLPVEKLEPYKI